jgi:esterase/lipase
MHSKPVPLNQIAATMDLPEQGSPLKGVILLVPCFTCESTLRALLSIAHTLTQRGYATLRLTLSGSEAAAEDISGESFKRHLEEVVSLADYARENISKDLIIVGHCLGGLISLFAEEQLQIKGLFTLGTSFDMNNYDFEKRGLEEDDHHVITMKINEHLVRIHRDYMGDLDQEAILDRLNQLRCPLMTVFFEEDETLDYSSSQQILKSTQKAVETILLNQITHLMDSENESYYIGNLIDMWAQTKLNQIRT